jgi:hypothetical protein
MPPIARSSRPDPLPLSRCAPLLAALALVAACAGPPRLTSETTFDGLVRVENSVFDQAWARPDLNLTGYRKLMLQGAGIEYRPTRATSGVAAGGAMEFPLSEAQKERLRQIMRQAFVEELAKSERYQLVNEPGPDVLLLRGSLLDVVSFIPPEAVALGKVYLRSVGEATLVLELRDSLSEAILARVADRRAAERLGGRMEESNPTMNAYEVDLAARRWARLVRERLDAVQTLDRVEDR